MRTNSIISSQITQAWQPETGNAIARGFYGYDHNPITPSFVNKS
jgi:hypothetical protein